MVVLGQRSVGQRVAVQVIDKAIKQFVSGVKIQQVSIARPALDIGGTQAAHPLRQAFLVGGQLLGQARGVGAGQRPTGIAFEQIRQRVEAGLDRRDDLQRATQTQAFKQLVQGVEARGDGHELAVHAPQPAIASAHVRVFESSDIAQAFQANRFSDKTYVAAFEAIALAVATQALDDKTGEHPEALVQGIAHRRTGRLRQDRGADQGRHQNPQGDFQHPPDRRHKRPIRVLQRRQADHRGGVTGEHKAIGLEGPIAHGTG
ncbi:hypothetical protein D3C81_591500 [compost metagenome]